MNRVLRGLVAVSLFACASMVAGGVSGQAPPARAVGAQGAAMRLYVLDGGEGLVLVDTGVGGRAADVRREVDRAARSIARDLAAIAITHAHADHTGSLAGLAAEFEVPILAGALDAPLIRAGRSAEGLPTGFVGRLGRALVRPKPVEAARVDVALEDGDRLRPEACQSPVWDTALAVLALRSVGVAPDHPQLRRAGEWLVGEEVTTKGDWAIRRPDLAPGGWAFEFENDLYPDVDDTAVVALALRELGLGDDAVGRGLDWIEGMQSANGGWGAFDADNEYYYLNNIPFADHGALLDPPTEDVTARCVSMLAQIGESESEPHAARVCLALAMVPAARGERLQTGGDSGGVDGGEGSVELLDGDGVLAHAQASELGRGRLDVQVARNPGTDAEHRRIPQRGCGGRGAHGAGEQRGAVGVGG